MNVTNSRQLRNLITRRALRISLLTRLALNIQNRDMKYVANKSDSSERKHIKAAQREMQL